MKRFITRFTGTWFGYTHRERRATVVLLLLIFLVILVRFLIPENNNYINISQVEVPDTRESPGNNASNHETEAGLVKAADRRVAERKIELNTCDSAMLVALPGIGPVLAGRIIRFRGLLGGYASADQLREVYGLPESTFEMIKDRVTANQGLIRRIDINNAGYRQLTRLPYLTSDQVSGILKYRDSVGKLTDIEALKTAGIISGEDYLRIAPYIEIK